MAAAEGAEGRLDLGAESWASGQRVRKRQPDGGSSAEGSSPRTGTVSRCFSSTGSGIGTASISPRVYGCAGRS